MRVLRYCEKCGERFILGGTGIVARHCRACKSKYAKEYQRNYFAKRSQDRAWMEQRRKAAADWKRRTGYNKGRVSE